tara:strand:- start:238 stop:477 length:240 start_codon:yes stop_codon:yes gene_type:complete
MELAPVKGFKHLVRDLETGAILNLDDRAPLGLKLAKNKRRKEQEQLEDNTNDINNIKSELTEIKSMLRILLEGKQDNGR